MSFRANMSTCKKATINEIYEKVDMPLPEVGICSCGKIPHEFECLGEFLKRLMDPRSYNVMHGDTAVIQHIVSDDQDK